MQKKSLKSNRPFFTLRAGKLLFLLAFMLMIGVSTFAQQTDPVGGDSEAPFDGGISLLVAAGVAYGAKQWHGARKGKKEVEEESENI